MHFDSIAVSGQMQSVNDSVDELKTRIAKLDKQLQEIQAQMQNAQAQMAAGTAPQTAPGGVVPQQGAPQTAAPAAAQAPPLDDTYQSGLRDYNSAHYDLASSEFNDVLQYYPHEDLAGNAQFYLGEIAYRQQKFKDAIKAYNAVLEDFSGNPKAPAAQLHKGQRAIASQSERSRHSRAAFARAAAIRKPRKPCAGTQQTQRHGR